LEWSDTSGDSGAAGLRKRVRDWVANQLERVDRSLEQARFRELQRLQKLFDLNPDEALRFAIPFRDQTGRGRATPGKSLADRAPHFDMNRISGGVPADPWDIPPQTRQNLLAQYRAAANRELALGRYLRAAYVFGELLGEFSSAANALEQGRYYREAATLYRDRLKNPAAAARCLKEGGLLLEAVVIYEEIGEFELAGDLHAAVGHQDDARRCYLEAVTRAMNSHAHLDAARLMETKLHTPDDALEMLLFQWPGSSSAVACLAEYFNLLQRLNRHEQIVGQIATLRDQTVVGERVQPLAEILSGLATRHPAVAIRSVAADATRVVAGRRLIHASGTEARSLVSAVTRLCRDDWLLARDGARFLGPRPKTYKLSSSIDKPRLVCEFRLPGGSTWKSAVSTGETYYAIGTESGGRTIILRGGWNGSIQTLIWPGGLNAESCMLEPVPTMGTLLLIPLGQNNQGSVFDGFAPSDGFPAGCRVGIPSWLPDDPIVGAGQDESGTIWISHARADHVALTAFSSETGQLLATQEPMALASTFDVYRTPIVSRGGQIFICSGETLWHLPPQGDRNLHREKQVLLARPCKQIVGSPSFTNLRVALAFDEGGLVIWDEGTAHPFAHGMINPVIGFTRGAALVAASRDEMRIYRTDGFKVSKPATFTINEMNAMAVCAASKMNEIGIIGSNGRVCVYEIPASGAWK
jgi:tetratricopeptide (TPR) repeat protein